MATHHRFASKKAFLFLFSLANIIQGMYSTYFVSTLTTIERLYEIQSKTVGAIMSATEFGQILGSLLVSYYGGKGNKPRWIAVCMTLSAIAAIISTSPHFLIYINNNNNNHHLYSNSFIGNNIPEHYSLALLGQGQLCSSSVIQPPQQPKQLQTNFINQDQLSTTNNQNWSTTGTHQLEQTTTKATTINQAKHKMKQPTEIIFVIFFFSLLVIGFGSTAMTTLGIPFIDDIVSREESPLYLGVTIGLRIFGPALGFLLGSVCIQLNVNFPFDPTTHDEANQTNSINWIGAWWLGLILISVPLLLLALPMYYFSFLTSKDTDADKSNALDKNCNLECSNRQHRIQSNQRRLRHVANQQDCYDTDNTDKDNNHHEDDDDDLDDGHDLNEKIIASSVPTSPTPSPIGNLTEDSLDYLHHNHNQHYIEYRLNDAFIDHERLSQRTTEMVPNKKTSSNSEVNQRQIHTNLRSIDTSNLLSLNVTKFNKSQQATLKLAHSEKNCCDDVDSVITKSSLDLSSGSSMTSNNNNNRNRNHRRERRRRYLSSSTSASSSDHQHHHDNQDQHHCNQQQHDGTNSTNGDDKHIKRQKIKAMQQQQQQQQQQQRRQLQKQNNKINSLSNSIRRLMRNKVFMLRLMSTVLHILPIAGFYTFLPKYLIEQFRVNASTASAISGLAGILFVGFGAFIGGSLMRIFNVNSKCVTRWIASSALAYAMGLLILMQLGCPQENLVTYDMVIRDSSYISHQNHQHDLVPLSCTNSCNCRQSVYNPICVQQTTYLSPCLAGCTNYTQLDNQRIIYNDCKCHMVTTTSNNDPILDYNIDDLSVTSGACKNHCGNLKWYIMVFSLFVLIHATCEVGSMMLNLRCVDSKDRALALGMVTFASSLLGTIPCSIIYGSVIDLTCIYWDTSEPESLVSATNDQTNSEQPTRGACRVYDNDRFRIYLHGLTALVMIFAFIIDSIICKKAGKINFFQQSPSDDEHADRAQTPNTTTITLQGSSLKQSNNEISDNFTIDRDEEEDDGVVGHLSDDDDFDCKLAEPNQRQIAIDCAAI